MGSVEDHAVEPTVVHTGVTAVFPYPSGFRFRVPDGKEIVVIPHLDAHPSGVCETGDFRVVIQSGGTCPCPVRPGVFTPSAEEGTGKWNLRRTELLEQERLVETLSFNIPILQMWETWLG